MKRRRKERSLFQGEELPVKQNWITLGLFVVVVVVIVVVVVVVVVGGGGGGGGEDSKGKKIEGAKQL